MYKEEISMIQIGLLMASFFVSGAGLYYHGYLLQTVNYNPFAPLFSGAVIALIPTVLASLICAKFPRDNIIGIARQLLGRPVGILITAPLVFIHFALPLPIFRIAAELITDVHLTNTPPIVLMLILLTISSWIALMGTEVVTRTNDEHLVIIFPLTAIMFFLSTSDIDPNLARPLTQFDFSYWMRPEFYGSLSVFFGFGLALFLNDAISHSQKLYRILIGLTFLGLLYLLVTLYLIIGTLGMEMASSFDQPLKVKMTTLREMVFFQRVDILLILLWMFPTITAMSGLIVTGARAVGQWLHLENYRTVVLAYFITALALRSSVEPFQNARNFLMYLSPLWGGLMTLLLLLFLILSVMKKRYALSQKEPRRRNNG
ncbi:GerAB/ArcD/ProY family transporter [Heliobacterium mobile]|nr:GerAB/ArcD/ProY family transporter [Heliobacterium mobile]